MRVKKSMFLYNCLTATSPHVSDPAQLCRWPRGLWNPPGGSFSTQVSLSLPTILPWGQTKTNHWVGLQESAWRGEEDWVIWNSLPPIGHWPKELTWVWMQLMFKVCAKPLFIFVGIFLSKAIMKPLITAELHTSAPHVIAAKQYILHTRSKQQ